ncbi:Serine/threonine-protein kinase dclk3, partial [Branchiostoma belcheri]
SGSDWVFTLGQSGSDWVFTLGQSGSDWVRLGLHSGSVWVRLGLYSGSVWVRLGQTGSSLWVSLGQTGSSLWVSLGQTGSDWVFTLGGPAEAGDREGDESSLRDRQNDRRRVLFIRSFLPQVDPRKQVTEKEMKARYDIGKTIGDGNFAVVKESKLKNTDSEYALKIIDKSKLRGKEGVHRGIDQVLRLCFH